jgi:hypothetical protein
VDPDPPPELEVDPPPQAAKPRSRKNNKKWLQRPRRRDELLGIASLLIVITYLDGLKTTPSRGLLRIL